MWDVIRSSSKGRMAIARHNIAIGSVVHFELPAAFVPYLKSGSSHSPTCGQLSFAEEDMLLAAKASIGEDFRGFTTILAARVISSCRMNPKIAGAVSHLCTDSHNRDTRFDEDMIASGQIVLRLLSFYPFAHEISLEFCLAILEKLRCNAFTVVESDLSRTVGIGLYVTAAAINHSCDPNCCQTFDASSSASLSIRAVRNISVGEEITIAYIDIGKPIYFRRSELLSSYGFRCSCSRCSSMSSDGYLCANSNCPGSSQILESDVFIWWKRYEGKEEHVLVEETKREKPSPKLLLSYPFGDDLEKYFHSSSLQKYHPIRLQCDFCGDISSGGNVFERVQCVNRMCHKMQRNHARGLDCLSAYKECVTELQKIVKSSHTCFVDLYRIFVLDDLILCNDFVSYVRVVRECNFLFNLSRCYPLYHPYPAIQRAMFAKCLLQICHTEIDRSEARTQLRRSLTVLMVTHGAKSCIIEDIHQIYQNSV